jgi:putative ABC transport system permease protein
MSTKVRFIVRNLERKPLRAALSSLGVAFSVAILVIGMFMFDGIERMMEVQFELAQQEDLIVSFNTDVGAVVQTELSRLDGVTRVELVHYVPVRLRAGHVEREVAISGVHLDTRLRRIVDEDGQVHPLPLEGVTLSAMLADRLDLDRGDTVRVEALTGRRRTEGVVVADVVRDLMGISAYMNADALTRLTGDAPRASGALLRTDGTNDAGITAVLEAAPAVASITSPSSMIASFEKQLDDSLYVAITFIVGFASVISVAVIYNGSRIALSERGRELASLRVLGFTRREVATLLFGEQAVITLAAIPLGWAIGYGLGGLIVAAMASETYRIPLVVSRETYLWSGLVTLLASIASAFLVRRRLNSMDLIAVLKTRE